MASFVYCGSDELMSDVRAQGGPSASVPVRNGTSSASVEEAALVGVKVRRAFALLLVIVVIDTRVVALEAVQLDQAIQWHSGARRSPRH